MILNKFLMKKVCLIQHLVEMVLYWYLELIIDLNESTNVGNVKELNDQISRRFLRECLNLPEVLYACLQRCIFCSYYDNRIPSISQFLI